MNDFLDRFLLFLPSISVLALIAVVTFAYLRWLMRRFGENIKSVEWREKNKWKTAWLIATPSQNVLAPAWEELAFRAPLVIAFTSLSSGAWTWMIISSVLFAAVHLFKKGVTDLDLFAQKKAGYNESDNTDEETERFRSENKKAILLRKILNICFTFILGMIAGYYAITHQSIWIAFWIHAIWNFVMPFIVILCFVVILMIVNGLIFLWERLRWGWDRTV